MNLFIRHLLSVLINVVEVVINDPYDQVYVLDSANNMNVKVFKLMSGLNETKFLFHH